MGKFNLKPVPMWAKLGHGRPTTRREFLAAGIIPFAARALVPGALGLLASPLKAAAECAVVGAGTVPFVTLNMSGGAGLSSNYMPLDVGGQPLASYSKMGNGSGANIPNRITEFGNPHFSANSQFIVGVRSTASQAARDRTAFIAGCVQSRDDSAENAFDASGLVYKSGLVGAILPNMGTRGTPTGIGMKPATISPPPPLIVNSFTTVANSIGYTATLRNSLTTDQRNKVAKLASSLSGSQARKLASVNSAAHVQSLVECAGIKNVGLIANGASAIDPLADSQYGAAIGSLYGINSGTAANNEQRVFSTMVYNALNGSAGTVNLDRGGYDYHDGSRTLGDRKDRETGEAIGRILEMAHIMQKPVFIYVTSDGAVASTDSASAGSNWVSDRGGAGMFFMLMYQPSGRPKTTAPQIGHYTSGQLADESTPIGSSPERAAHAALANYLKFAYGTDANSVFTKILPRGTSFDDATLASLIKVG